MRKIMIEVKFPWYNLRKLLKFLLVVDLLQSGVDPRIADKYGRTPLHVASTKMDAAIGKMF